MARNIFTYLLHTGLFILTFITVTIAGVQWLNKNPFELLNFADGLPYSLSLLAIISAHEFGHYFAAKAHNIKTTLPFYIPAPSFLINPFGTMGAVIRVREPLRTRKALFDIGIAGPVAGLVVTLPILIYGFATLPPKEFLHTLHPEYATLEALPTQGMTFGTSIFFWLMKEWFSYQPFIPPMNEIYHYPFLCAGWFGLFMTALNLLPIGQLDGGHILYALIGKAQRHVAYIFFLLLVLTGFASVYSLFIWKVQLGSIGWLLWAVVLYFIIKIEHPVISDEEPLSPGRKYLGWIILIFFLLTFPPIPFYDFTPF